MADLVRVQLDFPQETIDEMDALRADMGIATRKEFWASCYALMKLAANDRRQGRVVGALTESGVVVKQYVMPGLEALSPKRTE